MSGANSFGVLVIDVAVSGIAAFVAIMLWSLSREPAWILVVLGVVVRFGDVALQLLERYGIVQVADFAVAGIPVVWAVLRMVPWVAITTGFGTMIRDLRRL